MLPKSHLNLQAIKSVEVVMLKTKIIWLILLVIGVIVGVAVGKKYVIQPNIDFSQFKVTTLEGDPVNMNDLVGKPLIIDVWATWCAPCLKSMPHLDAIKRTYGDKIEVVCISDEEVDKIEAYLAKHEFKLRYFISTVKRESYGIGRIPSTFFYDKNGKLVAKVQEETSPKVLNKLVQKIIQ